jgi:hypothetical protein
MKFDIIEQGESQNSGLVKDVYLSPFRAPMAGNITTANNELTTNMV